jgi:hypothetical protein
MVQSRYVLCFRSLFVTGRGYAFPCDSRGWVDLDQLSERARTNYLYARAMVGRELSVPAVEPADLPTEAIETVPPAGIVRRRRFPAPSTPTAR